MGSTSRFSPVIRGEDEEDGEGHARQQRRTLPSERDQRPGDRTENTAHRGPQRPVVSGELLSPASCSILEFGERQDVHAATCDSGVEPGEVRDGRGFDRAWSKTERASWTVHRLRPPIRNAATAAAALAIATEPPKPTTSCIGGCTSAPRG